MSENSVEIVKDISVEIIEEKLRLLRQDQLRIKKIINAGKDNLYDRAFLGSVHVEIINLTLDLRLFQGS